MENHNQNQPPKCANNCGFFGNPLMQNFCSKCYRDLGLDKKDKPSPQMAPSSPTPSSPAPSTSPSPAALESSTSVAANAQPDTTRCFSCSRKVGLLGFKCRCEFVFCSKHRYSDQHTCNFDYQGMHKANLEKANPQVIAAKVQKI